MLRIEKLEIKKLFFKITLPREKKLHSAKEFFVESESFGSRQRNLCRVFISLSRVFLLALGNEATLLSVFLCREFFI
jgi:hypothetical protein